MTADDPNAEQASLDAKSEEIASAEKKEQASVAEDFKSQGAIDPNLVDGVAGEEPKKDEKSDKGKEGDPNKKEDPDKKEPEKEGKKSDKKKDEHLSDEDRDQKLFGEEKKGEEGKLEKGEEDFAAAQEKFSDEFAKAHDANDEKALAKIDKTVESKPKLAEKVSESLFDEMSAKIKEGDNDELKKLASLSNVAPKIADAVASKFWSGEIEDKKFFKGTKDLFEEIGFVPETPEKPDEKKEAEKATSQKEVVLQLELKLSEVAHGLNQSLEEFKKTALYDKFIEESSKFTQKGLKVDDFFETVKKAILSDSEQEKAKEEGAEEQNKLNNAGVSSPSGKGDDKGASGEEGFSDEENNMLDTFGVDKAKVAANIAKNKKK